MPHDFEASRLANLKSLRAGAALAVVLGVSAGALPAVAQTAAGPQASEASGPQPEAAPDDETRDTVFVFGRKVSSSIATLPAVEDATQVVNIISAETLAEQGVASLEQALRNVPGITTQIGEGGVMNGDQFFIRGLSAKDDIYTDGLRDFGVFTRDSFNYGQIEVLKGPSSTTLGRGTTGGGINTTSKTPYLETGGALTAAAGTAEYGRLTGDWNQVLGDSMAVRLNAMVHQNEVEGRDMIRSERWGFAPSIGFGLGGPTTFTLAAFHQEDDRVPDYGLPTATLSTTSIVPLPELGVPTNLFYGYDSDRDETMADTVTARLRHEANDWLSFTTDTKVGVYSRYFQQTVPNACANTTPTPPALPSQVTQCLTFLTDNNPATVPQIAMGGPGPYDQTTVGVQNISTATITAPVGGMRNELLVGWDVSWQNNDRDQFNYSPARGPKDLLNPAHSPNPVVSPLRANVRDSTAKDVSLFISDRLWFTDQWSISGGLRAQWYEMDQNTTTFTYAPVTNAVTSVYAPLSSNSDFVTPRVSVIYEPTPTQSYYVAYATSATPPGITVANGSATAAATADLDPEENESIEAGAKFQLFGDRLLVQTAVYNVKKNNAKEIDPSSGLITAQSGDSQEVTGFEIGAGGAVTDQWSINASYAYNDTETTESTTAINIGKRVPFAPEQSASLWTTYNFLGALSGLEVGGGVTYQGDLALNASNTGFAKEFTTLDGLISYGFDRYRISLNAYNLTDEDYYSQVHGNRVVPAAGRNFVATLGVVF